MSRLREFWLGWRKEIVRGGLIFSAVVFIGLVASRMFGWIPMGIAEGLGNLENIDWDHEGGNSRGRRDWQESYRWSGTIAESHWLWIRNTNGPVEVEPAEGESVVVVADKSSRRSNPDDVEIRVIEQGGGVTLCAVWHAAVMECGPEGAYKMKDQKKSDVAVRFRIMLPKGVKLNASTVNGGVEVNDAQSAVSLSTVNGRIHAVSTGPIQANTVNGSIHASMESLTGDDPVELRTVNGSITAELPAKLNAQLEASTVSGRINTELPLQLVGRVSPRQVNARIGTGGRRLTLSTVNGSIEINAAEGHHEDHEDH